MRHLTSDRAELGHEGKKKRTLSKVKDGKRVCGEIMGEKCDRVPARRMSRVTGMHVR